jgi:hypothetical protein
MSSHRSSLFGQSRHARGGSGSSGPHRSDRDMETELQNENDTMLDTVSVDMTRLKAAARTLRDEAEDHNRYLDKLEDFFGNAKDGVRGSITRLDGVMARYGCKDTFSFTLAIFVGGMLLYFLMKHVSFTSTTTPSPVEEASKGSS